jgi:hypothetical protein
LSNLPKATVEETNKKKPRKISFYVREFVAGGFWLFLFIKAFVYDLDLLITRALPILQPLYPYKFFLFLGLLSAAWVVLRTKRFLKTIGYVLVYPLVLLLWRIPKLLFRNWALLVIFAPAIESVLFTLKWRFAFGSLAILAALGIVLMHERGFLIIFMSVLILYLLVHYLLRLRVAFRPNAVFADVAKVVTSMWRESVKIYKRKDYEAHSGAGQQGVEYEKKRVENLKQLYLNNLIWEFFATKLNETVSSRRTDLYFIVAVLYSFLLTVTIFGFEYYGLSKVDRGSFQVPPQSSIWSFILFSFNVIMTTEFSRIVPVSDTALSLATLELFAGVITLVFFVYVLLTSSRERYREDLRNLALGLTQSSKEIERFLEKSLKMRLIDAEDKIIEHDPSFLKTMESFGRARPVIQEAEIVRQQEGQKEDGKQD